MSEDVLQRKRIELFAEYLKDGGRWEKNSQKLFADMMKNAGVYKKRAPKESDEYCMILALSEILIKLHYMNVIQSRLMEKTLDILAEAIGGEGWVEAMKRVSTLKLDDVIPPDKDEGKGTVQGT